MDDKTLSTLTALAQKLGTTGEYLWGVLLKQAPITGSIDLAVMATWVVAVVCYFRFVRRMTKKPAATDANKWPGAQWSNEEGVWLAWTTVVVAGLLTALIVGVSLSSTVAALLNPEYWALKQILK